jgi:hypothetical protein
VKEEPASRPLLRRTLLKRVVHGLGVILGLGHVIPHVQAEERDVLKNETDRLTVRVARPFDAETPVQEFASELPLLCPQPLWPSSDRTALRSKLETECGWYGGPTADFHAQ